jgi:hypothetical protein
MTIDMSKTRASISGVIEDYGSTIVFTPMTLTRDKWGDKTESDGSTVATVGIPYDIFGEKFNYQAAGDLEEGDTIIIIKYDETVATQSSDVRYKVTFDSIDYDVISIEDYDVAGLTLAKQVMAKRRI